MMIRLYITEPLSQGTAISLGKEHIHYLHNVMRCKNGDSLHLFNGKDGEWKGEVTIIGKRECELVIKQETRKQTYEPDIWLCFAPVKNIRLDFIAQKATELGGSSLQPIITQHTIARNVNIEKMHKNAIEAAEQCERLNIPKCCDPVDFMKLINGWNENEETKDRHIIFCDESGGGKPIFDALQNLCKDAQYAVFIGPEGGFSTQEFASMRELSNVTSVGMGPRILRADTAALAALSCLQASLGDWDKPPRFEPYTN